MKWNLQRFLKLSSTYSSDAHVCITNKVALGKVLDDVKKKMSIVVKNVDEIIPDYLAGQRKKMEESYFGHLFLQFNVKFNADLVHHLLRRQVHTSNRKYLEFNFEGNAAQFRKKEFDIITKLKMGPIPANNPTSSYERIRDDYFNGSDVITNGMVEDAYTNITQWMEDDDMVKLSLLYILECGLLRKESNSEIKLDHVSMVDDLSNFNAYPWGELAWEAAINSLQNGLEKPNSSGTYSLERWETTVALNYETLKNKLFNEEGAKASLGEENMLTSNEHGHDEHHDDARHDVVEPPLKKAHTNIHEGVDAHHSIPQQSPHQNVQQLEVASSR
ncbi:hypothetical protein FNV43_RR21223 [Rhamnella rubrinervis]|uniref:DUF1985 domain-containing protein n=1 Tax=Rhamnella rubrinervis TaxID=2594499 RepID=A0A8K0GUW9_9ROSA|nr:hypothetical protein FNV43_RR21223 [Rhamnella rubrinervis]